MTKNIKSVAIIADPKDHREALQAILFTGKQAVATDGYMLAITDSTIPEQKRQAKEYQGIRKWDEVGENGEIKKKKTLDSEVELIEPKILNCSYPEYEKIIPEEGKNIHLKVALGVPILEKLVKSLKANDSEFVILEFSDNPNAQIVGFSSDKSVKYVVMPVKVE